jgi:hypothetical protein
LVEGILSFHLIPINTTSFHQELPFRRFIVIMSSPEPEPEEKRDGIISAQHVSDAGGEVDPGGTEPTEISDELDKRITRKLDRRLMPWLFGLW